MRYGRPALPRSSGPRIPGHELDEDNDGDDDNDSDNDGQDDHKARVLELLVREARRFRNG